MTTELGSYLKEARVRSNLTQQQLSEKIRVSKQTVYSWETGRSTPLGGCLRRIAEALGVPLLKIRRMQRRASAERASGDDKRRKSILSSKDPVVSCWGPNFVPLLDKTVTAFPTDDIHNPIRWKGKRCFLPENFYPGHLFGFEITDTSMEPLFRKGDVILADTRQKPVNGQPAVLKIRGRSASCRLYSAENGKIVLHASASVPAEILSPDAIEWAFRTVAEEAL